MQPRLWRRRALQTLIWTAQVVRAGAAVTTRTKMKRPRLLPLLRALLAEADAAVAAAEVFARDTSLKCTDACPRCVECAVNAMSFRQRCMFPCSYL